jgi:predicted ATPase
MSLFFITGISGSGKSSLVHELRDRGYEAIDTDKGLSKWQHNETGYVHPKSSVKAADRTAEFLRDHSWNVPREEVEQLRQEAHAKPVFLCGVIDNQDELRDLFRARFALVIDDETLVHRLQTRTDNDWGKQPHELQNSLDRQHKLGSMYEAGGYIIVDATQDLMTVADFILQKVTELEA